jgi:hypothetical protein
MYYNITIKIKQILHTNYPITNIILYYGTIFLMIQSCYIIFEFSFLFDEVIIT